MSEETGLTIEHAPIAMETVENMAAIIPPVSALPSISTDAVIQQREHVRNIMRSVMKNDIHYGVIPGTGQDAKPSLLLPGCELLLNTFHIGVQPEVENITPPGSSEIMYRVLCKGIHLSTGKVIGIGVGEASTREESFAWRASVGDVEYNNTPDHRRRIKYKGGYNGGNVYQNKQVRQDPQGMGNRVLKIAKKRAQMNMVHTALAVSDIFTNPEAVDDGDQPAEQAPQANQNQQRRQNQNNNNARQKPKQNKNFNQQQQSNSPPLDSYDDYAASQTTSHVSSPQHKNAQSQKNQQATTQANQATIATPIDSAKAAVIRNTLQARGVLEAALLTFFEVQKIEDLKDDRIEDIFFWIQQQGTATAQ